MNMLSINIRGMGVEGKAGWVRGLRNRYGVEFIGLQESQVSGLSKSELRYFWGDGGLECDVVDAFGRSGGLVNIWNPKLFQKHMALQNQNFLATTGTLVADGSVLNIFNVYAPQRAGAKKRLWDDLAGVIRGCQGMVILMGDFNAVRFPEE